ncbi:proepiregulin-like protein [Cricetulus griseus]|uniref:Proepiregulin n=1 Tax=Cricetulus griseus TaxID=10029 RepID=A0A061IQP8_CRIGR|nr:proepiregulin-like protein [Cricetulus griseus]
MEMLSATWVLALLCLGFQLLQGAISTTVIPSCIPGDSQENCTALVQMEDNPRVAQVSITKCSSDMNGYCLHGQCIYLVDMSDNYCRCDVGYTGVRCEHFFLTVHKPLSKEYVALTVIVILLFLVIIAGSIYYFCRWYKYRESKKSKKEYERVTSGDPAVPQADKTVLNPEKARSATEFMTLFALNQSSLLALAFRILALVLLRCPSLV